MEENKITATIDYIKNIITDTIWEGHVFACGGTVRDIALGVEPKDLDIAIDKEFGGTAFATWLAHRTHSYVLSKNPCFFAKFGTSKLNITSVPSIKDVDIECSQTYKERSHTKATKTIFGTLKEDAHMRDLTINSLYLNISTGELLDLTEKGVDDIQNEILRTPSNPDKTFTEDPLRILRVVRFATKYGWGVEKNTWISMVTNAHLISTIAQERITSEINNILLSPKPSYGIKMLYNLGLLGYILPEVKALKEVEESEFVFGNVYDHTLKALDLTQPILENRLGILYHDIGKPKTFRYYGHGKNFYGHEDVGATMVEDILKRMKYSNETIKCVKTIVKNHMRFKQFKETSIPSCKMLRRFHASVGDYLDNVLDVIDADNNGRAFMLNTPRQIPLIRKKYEELEAKGETASQIKLPINGKEIMEALGIKSSPLIGQYLNKVKDAFLDNPSITKEQCLNLVKNTVFVD